MHLRPKPRRAPKRRPKPQHRCAPHPLRQQQRHLQPSKDFSPGSRVCSLLRRQPRQTANPSHPKPTNGVKVAPRARVVATVRDVARAVKAVARPAQMDAAMAATAVADAAGVVANVAVNVAVNASVSMPKENPWQPATTPRL